MKKQIQIILVSLTFLLFGKETFSQVFSTAEYLPSYLGNGRFYISKAIKSGSDVFTIRNESYVATSTTKHVAALYKNDKTMLFKIEYVSSSSALEFKDFIINGSGDFYIVGYTPEPVTFKQGSSAITGSFLCKVNAAGFVYWAKSITGNVKSVVSFGASKLLLLSDLNGPIIYSIDHSNGTNLQLEYQMAEGTASAGKLYSDGTRYYFTLTFTSSTIRLTSTWPVITNAGAKDAVLVNYNPTSKVLNWAEQVKTTRDDQINDLTFGDGNDVYFIGTSALATGNLAFLKRETFAPAQGGRFYTTANSDGEGVAVAYNSSENKVYGLYQVNGTVALNRTNFNDLLIKSYTPTSPTNSTGAINYAAQARLYAVERTRGGDILVTGTNEVQVFGSADGELSAQDNIGTRLLYNPATIYNTFRTILNTSACPSVASPSAISGPSNYCQGVSTNFSISPVSGATSYTWTLPNGWTGSSTSTSISIVPNSASGTISVKANNACGNSSAVVTKALTAGGAPAVPILINGPSNLCPDIFATYSIDSVSGASSYVWTIPSGWSGSSTSKSITVTASSNSGDISVSAKNSCGTSAKKTLAVLASGAVPAQPGTIEGDAYICINSSRTYTVPAVAGATSYTWGLPSGFVGNSTTNSITVETSANALNGSLSVRANNGCGSGTQKFLAITVQKNLPAKVASISGVSTGCPGLSSGFSVASVVGQSYQWSVSEPSFTFEEYTPNSGIQLTIGNRTGTVSVMPINACGVGPETTKEVIVQVPNAPVVSNVPASLCLNAEVSSYFTASSSGSIYEWSASSNVSPTATTSNTFLFKATSFGTDSIARFSVRSKSNCGYGDYAFVEIPIISVPAQPSLITGTTSPARNVATPYSVVKDPLATSYQWTASSQLVVPNLNEANITFYGSGLVTIYVSAVNACGSSVERSLEVTINQDNVAPIVSSLSPLNNATNVAIDANLVLTFSEPVVKVTGKLIQVVRVSGDVVVGNYTVDSPEITISGNTLTINPNFELETNTLYYVYIANGAVKDASNNFYTGMANSNFWKFTTGVGPLGLQVDAIGYEAKVQNPFSTSFSLNLPRGEVNVVIFDSKGVLVDEITTSEGILNHLGSTWSSGLYILQITSGEVRKQLKIVKQ